MGLHALDRNALGEALGMTCLVLGGVFADTTSRAATVLLGFTGLFGGAAHYAAVLADRPEREVERATGFGFFLGFSLGVLVLAIDATV